jgi:phenylalanyl-tRNA synthetase alpha chain
MTKLADIAKTREILFERFKKLEVKTDILKAPEMKELFAGIRTVAANDKATYGQAVNSLSQELKTLVASSSKRDEELPAIDVTAPFDANSLLPSHLPSEHGSIHPLMQEISTLSDIFMRMGFVIEESREIDDQYHMFETLNFPADHPARDEYDTFLTVQKDKDGHQLIAPAHTSTMQNRVLRKYVSNLENGEPIAVVVPDRVFRNEDLDARHEHTFYQLEGVYVSKGVHTGMLIATLQTFLQEYYGKELEIRTNPFYFPFTEPSLEISLSCPFCDKKGCRVCSHSGWIELLGCGMIHPNVLKMAGIDPTIYTGFAWGVGIDRLVMMKYGIEDVRHFESAKLDFLRQF